MATLYYNQSTPSSGSADPLRRSIEMRTLFSDGLGAARGQRLRKGSCASYPTRQVSFLASPLQFKPERMVGGPDTQALLSFAFAGMQLAF